MLKPIVRLTVATLLWKNYRRHIGATLLAIASILVVVFVHQDFIEYTQQLKNPENVGISFVIKWILFVTIIVLWLYTLSKISRSGTNDVIESKSKLKIKMQESPPKQDAADPFEFIRNKRSLRSRADVVLQSKERK